MEYITVMYSILRNLKLIYSALSPGMSRIAQIKEEKKEGQ